MKKNKARKKGSVSSVPATPQDQMEALRAIIQGEISKAENQKSAKKPVVESVKIVTKDKPSSATTKKDPAPSPQQPTQSVEKMTKNNTAAQEAPSAPQANTPDLGVMTTKILQIAARSQKLLNAFMDRNKTFIRKMPSMDPGHLGEAFADFTKSTLAKPDRLIEAQITFWQDYVRLLKSTIAAQGGQKKIEQVIAPAAEDKRFKDPAWQEVWIFDYIKQSYLLFARWAQTLVDHIDGIDPKEAHKIEFYTHQFIDALSPTNFWLTNPEVLRTTIETKGENLINGLKNLLDDIERGQGQLMVTMTDSSVFKLGENIATTKGKVVYQNELMQLIQYAPLTPKVHQTPFLIVPPWINKFYILDLKAENSYIKYIVEQGYTVFCISWINPDARHAEMNFDDYMMLGPVAAATEIAKITGEKSVSALGYCIGGTLLATTLGWLAALGDKKPAGMPDIASATYLVSLIDFENPGDLGVFIDEEQIELVESMMEGGFMPASKMGATFAMLRANDLVWSFVINNYLLGREPFPFDLLAWNCDSTNLPRAMQSYYLRNMYLKNKLIKPNALSMKGVPINLFKITVPSFCISTHDDHITPWRSTYVATQTYSGPVTFCLSGSGHIAGVVNPPAKKKYGYWLNETTQCPPDPEQWLKAAKKQEGSWWPAWIKWLDGHSGAMVEPRDPATNQNVIEDAPGSYVRVKA